MNKKQRIGFWLIATIALISLSVAAYSVLSTPARIEAYVAAHQDDLRGPAGPQGAQGEQGASGIAGANGSSGVSSGGLTNQQSCEVQQSLYTATGNGFPRICN